MGGSGAGPGIGLASASRISLALATATLSRVGWDSDATNDGASQSNSVSGIDAVLATAPYATPATSTPRQQRWIPACARSRACPSPATDGRTRAIFFISFSFSKVRFIPRAIRDPGGARGLRRGYRAGFGGTASHSMAREIRETFGTGLLAAAKILFVYAKPKSLLRALRRNKRCGLYSRSAWGPREHLRALSDAAQVSVFLIHPADYRINRRISRHPLPRPKSTRLTHSDICSHLMLH